MAEKEAIILEIDVNSEDASKALADVTKRIDELNAKRKETKTLTAEEEQELKRLQREQKNLTTVIGSQKGSYDQLSAACSRNKSVLNAMSKEQRYNTEEGKKLEAETKALYAQMNEMQKATGKYTLQVGNYELAGKSLRTELKELTVQLQQMKLEGKENSKEYADLIARAGELKDTMDDTNAAIKHMGSDTSNLDAILGGASAATGGFAVATSAMSMLGASTESVQKAQKKLQEAIALVNGVQAISNALNKDSALRVKLNALAQKILAKQTEATAAATRGATTAMKGLKAALVSTGVGALVVALGFVVEKLIDMKDASDDVSDSTQNLDERAKKAADDLTTSYENLANARKNYNNVVREHNEAEGGTSAVIKNLNDDMEKQKQILKDAQDEIIVYQGELKSLNKAHDGFVWLIEDAKKKGDDDLVKSLKADLAINESKLKSTRTRLKNTEALEYNTNANIIKIGDDLKAAQAAQEEAAAKKREDAAKKREAEEKRRTANKLAADVEIANIEKERYDAEKRRLNSELALTEEYSVEAYKLQAKMYEMDRDNAIKNGTDKVTAYNEYMKNIDDLDAKYNKKKDDDEMTRNEERKKLMERYEKDLNDARIEIVKGDIDATAELKKEALKKEYDDAIANAEKIGADTAKITQSYNEQIKQIDIEAADAKIGIAQSMVGNIADALGSLFEENKGMQIASTVASTIADAAATYSKTLAQGGAFATPLAITSAASVVARGIAAIQKLSSTNKNSKSIAGGGSISRTTSSVNETIVQRTAGNIVGKSETPQHVLVVDEVTAKQMQISQAQKLAVQ